MSGDHMTQMRRATTAVRMLRVLFLFLAIWLRDCCSTATGIYHHDARHGFPRIDCNRAAATIISRTTDSSTSSSSVWRGRTATPVVACMSHCSAGGAAALAGPFLSGRGRGSTQPRGGPPVLWALVTAAGVVVVTSAKSAVSQLLSSEGGGEEGDGAANKVGTAMISFVKAYKKELSPLIPPACRFLPTCSVYAVEAIEKFGPTKGAVLTAWRLMRCNPFAGYGVDHPQWPPPGWFAGKKW